MSEAAAGAMKYVSLETCCSVERLGNSGGIIFRLALSVVWGNTLIRFYTTDQTGEGGGGYTLEVAEAKRKVGVNCEEL